MKNPETILVAVDFSPGSRAALLEAQRLGESRGASVEVVHIINEAALAAQAGSRMASPDEQARHAIATATAALIRWMELAGAKTDGRHHVAVGGPLHEILEMVRSLKPDLLVAGISGAGDSPAGAGSVSAKLARKVPCGVLLVSAKKDGPFRKIVAGIDFSEAARDVAAAARWIALKDGAAVDFVHVWQQPWQQLPYAMPFGDTGMPVPMVTPEEIDAYESGARQELHEYVAQAGEGLQAEAVLYEGGNYGHVLAEQALASAADLIIVGDKGRTNLRYVLLGSTAEKLLTRVPCSLLVVKPPRASTS